MISLTQYDGAKLMLAEKPATIVSLVPSITENLIQFGTIPAARTSFCIEPKDIVQSIPVIGGTKTPRVKKIIDMKPDLVIANQEENIREHIEQIQAAGIPVWVTYPATVQDLVPLMQELGEVSDDPEMAMHWINQTRKRLTQKLHWTFKPKIVTLIWKDPWMAVGKDTYTSSLIEFCGGINPVKGRYPALTMQQIQEMSPDILLLPTEPYEFDHQDFEVWKRVVPEVISFSGEDLLWSGTRWLEAAQRLTEICKSFQEKQLK
ncbi:MAG: helical backbone metal receptor [Bdellovibrionota bacterium]